jgi:hypothetical protein
MQVVSMPHILYGFQGIGMVIVLIQLADDRSDSRATIESQEQAPGSLTPKDMGMTSLKNIEY